MPTTRGKSPRTARGERTRRKILDAALHEFGEHGFSDASIVGITGRAEVALGTFYTYFDSKEEVFRAVVRDLSELVRTRVAPMLEGEGDAIDRERRALGALLELIASRKQVYRIIDEAEFVDPAGYERHYSSAAERIAGRLREAAAKGEVRAEESAFAEEVRAWAIMGANVFVGLRFGVWETADSGKVAEVVSRLLRHGLQPR
ncbi:MAG TPA: TetR/AcrR family transcriptional regulator [Sphingomicrobium sp.]|nr:TetR/AcrR family transcriptional regulator [Sphingomicrobium sp.]